MTRVLLIGIKPESVDTSDPDLPPGTTVAQIASGIDATLTNMKARGLCQTNVAGDSGRR